MNKKRGTDSRSGLSEVQVLQLMFIALKLMGYINWSWFWVLSPTWIGFLLIVVIVILVKILSKLKR